MTNPGATRRQLLPVESAKKPDAITRKTPSTAQHLCPSNALHTKGKGGGGEREGKVHIKSLMEMYIHMKATLI